MMNIHPRAEYIQFVLVYQLQQKGDPFPLFADYTKLSANMSNNYIRSLGVLLLSMIAEY